MAHIPLAIEVRYLRIPAQWNLRDSNFGLTLVPEIDQSEQRKFMVLDDPWKIRDQFLRLKHTEEASLDFLQQVGVWNAVEDRRATETTVGRMLMAGSFGHRLFFGRALPITLEQLWRDQAYWKELLSDEDRLRKQFSSPLQDDAAPFEKADFAMKSAFLNTLPLHIDWQKNKRRLANGHLRTAVVPCGIIQPFSGWELLVTTAHLDLLRKANFQICQRPDCAIPFTGRSKQYCCWYCGHLESLRRKRLEEKRKNAKKR